MIVRALAGERLERRQGLPTTVAGWRALLGGSVQSSAGPRVSPELALQLSAVWSCVRVISESIGQLPLILYRRKPNGGGRERATDHPLYRLLHLRPNPFTTAAAAQEFLGGCLALRGNALSVKVMRGSRVVELWPLRWDRVEPRLEGGELVFRYTPAGGRTRTYRRSEVWYSHGLSADGLTGMSPIEVATETIGFGIAARRYGSAFYRNGAHAAYVFEGPGGLSPEAYARLKASLDEHRGADQAHGTLILEEGLKWSSVGLSQRDAQALEHLKMNRTEVASIFRVPPHMIADLERATFSNIEHQSLEFVVHTLGPWLKKLEQSATVDLLTEQEQETLYFEFLVDGLLRGDAQARAAFYSSGITAGWLSRNEARERENLDRRDGLDEMLEPLNLVPAGGAQDGSTGGLVAGGRGSRAALEAALAGAGLRLEARAGGREGRATPRAREALARAFVPVFTEAAERALRAENRELRKLADRHLAPPPERAGRRAPERRAAEGVESMLLEVDRLYGESAEGEPGELRKVISARMTPAIFALGESIFDAAAGEVEGETDREGLADVLGLVVASYVARHATSSAAAVRGELLRADQADARAALEALLTRQLDERPARIARKETVHQSRYVAKQAYARSGVEVIRWRTRGDTCPFCKRLDGAVVSISGSFVPEGTTWEAEGRKPLTARTAISHPPLHRGCDCDIEPG